MSYAVEPPAVGHRRPPPVVLAAGLLIVMALVGLGYAIATLAMTSGTVNRFRAAADGLGVAGADGYVAALWLGAGVAIAVAVVLFALYIALALGLCRGSAVARLVTWVVCGLGLIAGCGSTVIVAAQGRATSPLVYLVADAYPRGWVGLNLALSTAQVLGYLVVAVLLMVTPRGWFAGGDTVAPGGPYPGVGSYPANPSRFGGAPLTSSYAQQYPGQSYSVPPAPTAPTPPPESGPDDQYWARPPM